MNASNGYHLVITPGSTAAFSGTYVIKNVNSGLALDTSGSGTAQGTLAVQATASGSGTQKWTLVPEGSGFYEIENSGSGLLLGVTSESKASGAQVLQWTDNGTADHLWTLTAS
jgi:hypothetical protein